MNQHIPNDILKYPIEFGIKILARKHHTNHIYNKPHGTSQ